MGKFEYGVIVIYEGYGLKNVTAHLFQNREEALAHYRGVEPRSGSRRSVYLLRVEEERVLE